MHVEHIEVFKKLDINKRTSYTRDIIIMECITWTYQGQNRSGILEVIQRLTLLSSSGPWAKECKSGSPNIIQWMAKECKSGYKVCWHDLNLETADVCRESLQGIVKDKCENSQFITVNKRKKHIVLESIHIWSSRKYNNNRSTAWLSKQGNDEYVGSRNTAIIHIWSSDTYSMKGSSP